MISCILLSAGKSSRFGSLKALADLNGQTIIEQLQRILLKTNIDEIIIVLGFEMERIKPFLLKHEKIQFVYNKDYNFGQTSSFKAGLAKVSSDSEGVLLLPVDYAFIRPETIDYLISQFRKASSSRITIPSFDGKKGHPLLFKSSLYPEYLALSNDVGINTIGQKYPNETQIIPVSDGGVIKTFNTPEEFEQNKQT
jgi:molybdenum cofactor cytidylyltransferase